MQKLTFFDIIERGERKREGERRERPHEMLAPPTTSTKPL